ncbi:MAG: hypothetical protein QMD04_10705 [Anaerolineales bacterium]|nr:hypothetical protein [Anaerolineales bacterium]
MNIATAYRQLHPYSRLILLFQLLDLLTTFFALTLLTGLVEGNPLVHAIGWPGAIMLKVAVVSFSIYALETIRRIDEACLASFKFAVAVSAFFPLWNTLVILAS